MTSPAGRAAPQLLLFAEPMRLEGLRQWLKGRELPVRVVTDSGALEGPPQLVIWCLARPPGADALTAELRGLQERWQRAPLLLLLPSGHPYPTTFLLQLQAQGVLQDPEREDLLAAVDTLLAGGRVFAIPAAVEGEGMAAARPAMGLGQWLLFSGLQQIDADIRFCRRLLDPPPQQLLPLLLLQGRLRELHAARTLLLWLLGPLTMAWGEAVSDSPLPFAPPLAAARLRDSLTGAVSTDGPGSSLARFASPQAGGFRAASGALAITLRQRDAAGIGEALFARLREAAAAGPENLSGRLLALDGLQAERRRDLLLALLEQFEQLRLRLQNDDLRGQGLLERWRTLQPELRQQALRRMAGSYVQLPREGGLLPVADTLVHSGAFQGEDPELPDPDALLASLTEARPLLVEGRLLAPDEPQALLYLETLLANWLVRSAELISAEVLGVCAEWPELRRYLLRPDLLPTRNLERLRNRLNAQQRWMNWFDRPIQLFESRRALFRLEAGAIQCIDLTEPRDQELRQLGWIQQAVTLGLEARDALAPQLQALVRRLGDLVVVVLTRVIGQAIGLIGRGIAQGMGRSLGRG